MELTPTQDKHAPSIRWLLNGPRGCGKTFLLQAIMIEKGMKELGQWQSVFDHSFNDHGALERFLRGLSDVFAMSEHSDEFGISIKLQPRGFKIDRRG